MIGIDPELIREIVSKEKRIDNRSFDEYRSMVVEQGVVKQAEGSARVRIGNTEVIAGVKMDVGEPFADTPDEGVLMVAAELLPLASPEFEAGPPGEQAIELARVVDRAIRESKVIDFKKLCIKPEEKVWVINVDIDVLDDDGNLFDAACLAAVAALKNAKIPELDEKEKPIYGSGVQPLPMKGLPVSTTFAKIAEQILVDPNLAELDAMDARLTVGTVDTEDGVKFCSLQKGGAVGISIEELEKILELAERKGKELRKKI